MKKQVRIISVLLLVGLYGLAMQAGHTNALKQNHTVFGSAEDSSDRYISYLFTNIAGQIVPANMATGEVTLLPFSSVSNFQFTHAAYFRGAAAAFVSKARQYFRKSGFILFRHRKADFLYPFHYFW